MSMSIKNEKPTPLGSRVYRKHRKLVKRLSRKMKMKGAAVVRFAIEDLARRKLRA